LLHTSSTFNTWVKLYPDLAIQVKSASEPLTNLLLHIFKRLKKYIRSVAPPPACLESSLLYRGRLKWGSADEVAHLTTNRN